MNQETPPSVSLVVLGTIQDGGSPHMACRKACCKTLFRHPDRGRKVVSLGLVDQENGQRFLVEATPDLPSQWDVLQQLYDGDKKSSPDGIFLTHAHIGHYTGLMYLGKEAMDAREVPVYVMPRMKTFLETNGPWSQLVTRKNIRLREMRAGEETQVSPNIRVTPILVPHRDEFSETVGFRIKGPHRSVLFIPDIDKWQKWDRDLIRELSAVDYALLDATFYSGAELNHRNMDEIPHPSVEETMKLLSGLDAREKNKIRFIHCNHTNPLLNSESRETREVLKQGFQVARFLDRITL